MKNKVVAGLLAIVGGSLGLHKFYLGDKGAGIFYIFLTLMTRGVFPIALILGFIDGMRYLMMPPAEFDRKFNNRSRKTTRSRRSTTRRSPDVSRTTRRKTPRSTVRVRSNPFKKSGLKKYKDYEIEEAIDDFHKALKIDPRDASVHFNLACAYSLMENKDEAFRYLELAVMRGMTDHERILKHDDLAFLRIQPEFENFRLQGFKNTNQKSSSETPFQTQKPKDDILLAQLNRLMELRKKGVLTEQEFLRERKKVMVR